MGLAHIVIHSWYPAGKLQEVWTRFGEISQEKGQTESIKSVKSFTSTGEKGIHVAAYHEVEEGGVEEALLFLLEFMAGFATIEGYRYRFDFAMTPEEIMQYNQRISGT
jgi:hypothetical protein